MSITTSAARSILATIKAALRRNTTSGLLAFDTDGTGGAWYADNARHGAPLSFSVRSGWTIASIREAAANQLDRA